MLTYDLCWLLGQSADEFWSEKYEKSPALWRGDGRRFNELFGMEDFERYLTISGCSDGAIVLAPPGGTSGRLDPHEVELAWRAGYSVIAADLHKRWPEVITLAADLGAAMCCALAVNAYLSPPEGSAFARHYDAHDVFILQTYGSKHWLVFDPADELPVMHTQNAQLNRDSALALDAELRAGDVLYVPRGHPHVATAGSEGSLHLTVALSPSRWVDLAHALVDVLAQQSVELRRTAHDFTSFTTTDLMRKLIEANDASASICMTELQRYLDRDRVDTALPGGALESLISDHERVGLDTVVQRRRGGPVRWGLRDGRVWLTVCGRRMELPEVAVSALEYLSRTEQFRISNLPDAYSDRAKVTLVRAWLREGIVLRTQVTHD
ncbi:cupin domain-containing protein [Rhodococcus sp. A14]|uniref:JmjC domain-containing protein n=1 Tax=Rhodococcus sp. A14 TaxID=1194106 RepID=UPI001423E653|nr:hypothetical protein [Rhodococcus sp. A14]